MRALEQAELWRRIREQARLRRELAIIFVSAVLATAVLLAWAQRLIWKYGQQRAEAEAEVRRLNAGLEQKVAQQTASLVRANEELRRSNSDLERFAWIATHDLQEPLRMVTNYVALLAKRYEGRLDEDADTYIEFASENAKRMRELIDALLTYVRAGVERPRLSSVECERLLADILCAEHVKITAAGAVVTHDPLPVITSDQALLSSVFRNLIDNAIKFRKPDEPARVHIGAREVDGAWQFSFRDEGIGFDQRYAERILVLFQKLHAPGEYPGTGLGLAVARRIVEGLGGHLTAESEPGRGATFFVTLPGAEAAEGTRQPAHT